MSDVLAPMYPDRDPARRCRKFQDWPAADQAAWNRAVCGGDIFDERGEFERWSEYSRRKTIKGYGRWLTWLDSQGSLQGSLGLAKRVTPKLVAQYVTDLEALNASMTILSRLQELHDALKAMAPEFDWRWVRKFGRRVRAEARPAREKRSRMRHTAELLALGMKLMDETNWPAALTPLQRAVEFRDGFMIALLAMRPIRIKNFASMTIGRHILKVGAEWTMSFPASETKTGTPIDMPIPPHIVSWLEIYLTVHRALLCKRSLPAIAALWVSKDATSMQEYSIYCRIVKRTARAYGMAINPHLFRDCAATSIAIDDPGHVQIIAPLLGHTSLATGERYYNQARALEASRLFHGNVVGLRKATRANGKGTL